MYLLQVGSECFEHVECVITHVIKKMQAELITNYLKVHKNENFFLAPILNFVLFHC
jgi:hypothetical protein